MLTSQLKKIGVLSIGGTNIRRAQYSLDADGRTALARPIVSDAKKYSELKPFYDDMETNVRDVLGEGQNRFVIDVAAEVKGDTIQALTNHGLKMQIPLVKEMEERFPKVTFHVIGDVTAATFAECGEGGALAGLPEGSLCGAMVWGTGVGFNLYRMTGGTPRPVEGVYAFGHEPVPASLMKKLGMEGMLGNKLFQCGCGRTGKLADNEDPCFESVVSGPGIESLFKTFLERLAVRPVTNIQGKDGEKAWEVSLAGRDIALKDAANPLIGTILDAHGLLHHAADNIKNSHIARALALTGGKEPICNLLLSKIGALFAYRMQQVESQFASVHGPLNVAFVGSVGHHIGPYAIPHIRAFAEQYLYTDGRKPVWLKPEHITNYSVGNIDPEEADLRGCLEYYFARQLDL